MQAELARQTDPEFVFASKFTDRARLARHSLSQALDRVIDDLTRAAQGRSADAARSARTVATGMARLGIPRDDRLAVLAHSYDDVHAVYDKFERLPQKRAALEAWEQHVRKVIGA